MSYFEACNHDVRKPIVIIPMVPSLAKNSEVQNRNTRCAEKSSWQTVLLADRTQLAIKSALSSWLWFSSFTQVITSMVQMQNKLELLHVPGLPFSSGAFHGNCRARLLASETVSQDGDSQVKQVEQSIQRNQRGIWSQGQV